MNKHEYTRQMTSHEDASHFHLAPESNSSGEMSKLKLTTPNMVMDVRDKESVEKLLEYYSHQTNWKGLIPDSRFARRYYVEKIRPTLRFYCKKYGVEIPTWLKDDKFFTDMGEQQRHGHFGPGHVQPIDYTEVNFPSIKDYAAQHEEDTTPIKPEPKAKPKAKPKGK